MKRLIMINGTMGVGKTAASKELLALLPNCAFLDGDWCWDMNPFVVNSETKNMVVDNIVYVLNNFLKCSVYENIVFCWVMHEEYIMDQILSRLNLMDAVVHKISLVCSEQALTKRLSGDVERGIRTADIIPRSVSRLRNYASMDTIKIDVSKITANEAAQQILMQI